MVVVLLLVVLRPLDGRDVRHLGGVRRVRVRSLEVEDDGLRVGGPDDAVRQLARGRTGVDLAVVRAGEPGLEVRRTLGLVPPRTDARPRT